MFMQNAKLFVELETGSLMQMLTLSPRASPYTGGAANVV